MPNIRWLLALITVLHRFVYRASGGRLGSKFGGAPMLLLTNVGRKTGKLRMTPLLYVEDRDQDRASDRTRWVVIASNAGDDRHPAWWLNLQSRPDTTIQVGTAHHDVRARRATPVEVERIWPKLVATYGYYDAYRERAPRDIPVVILAPRGGAG